MGVRALWAIVLCLCKVFYRKYKGAEVGVGVSREEMSKISPQENKIKLVNRNSQGLLVIEVEYHEFKMVTISKVVEFF